MRQLIREPLVHFALAALAIFGFHIAWSSWTDRIQNTITITTGDMERLATLYASEAGTAPTANDMKAIVADHIRNEALAREARKLGLHIGDTIVDRRLAQKMTFLVSDLASLPSPSEAELKSWYEMHADRFTAPARVTFDHIFLSAEERKRTVRSDAESILGLMNSDQPPDWRRTGDPFMLSRSYGDLPLREVARLFGNEFASALSKTPEDKSWQGPLTSAFGEHVVRVTHNQEADLPPFDDIQQSVLAVWEDVKRREQNAAAIQEIIQKYHIVVESPDGF